MLCCTTSLAQEIEMHKSFWGYRYYQGDQVLTLKEVAKTVRPNAEAFEFVEKSYRQKNLTTILGVIGGFCVGYPLGSELAGGEAVWPVVAIGAGLIVISFPVSVAAGKNAQKGIDIYNSSLTPSAYLRPRKYHLSLATGQDGIGLRLQFN